MPTLTITKTYVNGNILTQNDLDNAFNSVSTFINTTKLDSNNIQLGGLLGTNLANGTISIANMGSASVGAPQLASSAVTTAAIGPLAVTNAQRAALGEQLSSLSSTAQNLSSGYQNVAALTQSITTNGRAVFVGLVAAGSSGQRSGFGGVAGSGDQFAALAFTRDGLRIGEYGSFVTESTGTIFYLGPLPYHIDTTTTGPGTYSYGVQISAGGGGAALRQVKLVAFEL